MTTPIRSRRLPGATHPVLFLALSLLLGAAELRAQAESDPRAEGPPDAAPAVLEGTVRSAADTPLAAAEEGAGTPLPGAEVWILGTEIGTLTDDDGRFRLTGLPPGRYRLLVGARGHREAEVAVDVAAGDTGRVDLGLETTDAQLERRAAELAAEAEAASGRSDPSGFQERMASGFGEYVTRVEIDAADTHRLSEVIEDYTNAEVQRCSGGGGGTEDECYWVVTGTRLRIGGLEGGVANASGDEGDAGLVSFLRAQGSPHGSAGRPCIAEVYLDGVPLDQESHPTGIDIVPTSQVEGIEIYKRGALAPPRYRSVGGCGIVLLWSRTPGGSGST